LENLRLNLILKGEDKHLASPTLAKLDGLDQKSSELISFVFLDHDDSRLYSFGLVEKGGK
jgi:hypothetical protein